MPKISVIMPLYNAQKYLGESLESVLNQTFFDFELLCINDASEDMTLKILEEYMSKDKRIRVLKNKEHSGAAYSRNKGLCEAKGKYVIFLDGDDIFDEDMLFTSYQAAERNQTDILMFSHKLVGTEQIHNKKHIFHGSKYMEKYCRGLFSVEECNSYEFLLWSTAPWNKLFRKKFILDNDISYQSLSCSNDVYFINMSLLLSKKTMVLEDNRVMTYVRDHDEPSRISCKRDPMCNYKAYEYLLKMLISKGKLDNLYQHFFYKALFSFMHIISYTECRNVKEAERFYKFLQKEGIERLKYISKDYEKNGNSYLKYIFNQFVSNDFESRWYKRESILKIYLEEQKETFCQLFERKGKEEKIVVWGAGQNGQAVLSACRKGNVRIDYVVDISKDKQGKCIEGYCVMAPEHVLMQPSFIIVTAYGIFEEVQKWVERYNIKAQVVDIASYLAIV